MEVAIIDWKNIDSRFVKDDMYERISAPKWIDFSAADDPVNDDAWFCRPSCNHPKTAEDFFKEKERTPSSNFKLQENGCVSEILPLGDRNRRDATLKKRGLLKDIKNERILENSENQNPNFSMTPPNHKDKLRKEAIKSSTEKKPMEKKADQTPRLKSTLSARNLFPGGDLLNKVAEFCNELKKLAATVREGGRTENKDNVDEEDKEKKPLLQLNREKMKVAESSTFKDDQRRMKNGDVKISVEVKNALQRDAALQIRTSPPTPQCFSASRGGSKAATPRVLRSKPQRRGGILQELKQTNREEKMVEHEENSDGRREALATKAEKEARTLNPLWFLKPCTLSS